MRSRVRGWLGVAWLVSACSPGSGDDEIAAATNETESESESGSSSESESGSSSESESGSSESSSESESESTSEDSSESTSEDSSESTSEDSSTDTGDPLPDCEPLLHAPPATIVDGLPAVAIDILALEGLIDFDLALQQGHVEVTMSFQLGPEGGMPIFDLRQSIGEAELDGQPLAPELIQSHDFGKSLIYGFRIVEQELEPCSVHTLWLSYPLALPNAPSAGGLGWGPSRLYFDTWLSDLNPGRYIESWLPANLPFDRQPISLGITLAGAGVEHTLISNAALEQLGIHDWQLEFPDSTTAMAPLIAIVPSEELVSVAGIHAAANGQDVPYSVYRHQSVATPIASFEANLRGYIDEFVLSTGSFEHPAMTVYIGASLRSMEYDGALTTKPPDLEHEAFHSWWARGVHPATYADGWIDEAWDNYNTSAGATFTIEPFNWNDSPQQLFDPHPFARDTPDIAYTHGRRVFAGLAAILGLAELRAAMAALYEQVGPLGSLTTAELERHLYCTGGESLDLRQAFWRFVYANAGQAPAPPLDYCG
ncbi:hypothetical protein ACNOYE_37415 [Nannocystaceae bacterium ST9]